jgi:hypothetical protein
MYGFSITTEIILTLLRARRLGFNSRQGQSFSLLHSGQAGSGAHPASYSVGTGGGAISPEVKRPGREADHSSPSSAEVKNGGAIPPGANLPYFSLGAKTVHILSHVRLNVTTFP